MCLAGYPNYSLFAARTWLTYGKVHKAGRYPTWVKIACPPSIAAIKSRSQYEIDSGFAPSVDLILSCDLATTGLVLAADYLRQRRPPNDSPDQGLLSRGNVRMNAVHVDLNQNDLKQIQEVVDANNVSGQRSYGEQTK